MVSRLDARRTSPECSRCRGIFEIVLQRHRHRHFADTLFHDPEIPRLQPSPAVLGIRESGKDAAIHHQPVVIEIAGLHPVGYAHFRAIKLFVAGRFVNDGKNAPAKLRHERYLQIAILEHVGPERTVDNGLLVERPADESVLRIGRVVDGAPRHRRLTERYLVRHWRRRMQRDMKRTDRRKYRNRETDRGTRGSTNCHFRHFRMSWSNYSTTPTRPSPRPRAANCLTPPPRRRSNQMDHGSRGTFDLPFMDASQTDLGWPSERSRDLVYSLECHNQSLQSRVNWDKITSTWEVTHRVLPLNWPILSAGNSQIFDTNFAAS